MLKTTASKTSWVFVVLFLMGLGMGGRIHAGQLSNEMAAPTNYDEVVASLIGNLDKDKVVAQDAARKLVNLGKRAVPILSDMYAANSHKPTANKQVLYYTVWALSQIRFADAAAPLLPMVNDEKADPELRNLAIDAEGLERLDDGPLALQKLAMGNGDIDLRKKAFSRLSLMPNFMGKAEKLFVSGLSDPNDEIRTLAARQCYFAHMYLSATDKLIELSEKDPQLQVRAFSILALSRMRVQRAVPVLVRICTAPETPQKLQESALRALQVLTGATLKDPSAAEKWWKERGQKQFEKLEQETNAAEKKEPGTPVEPQK